MKRISNLGKLFGMLVLVALMICTFAVSVSAASFSTAQNSVVAVVSERGTNYATGIAIGEKGKNPGYILTTYSVLDSSSSEQATVYFSFDTMDAQTAKVHYSNPDMGIVVLRLTKRTEEVVPCTFLSSKKVGPDTDLRGICYPNNLYTLNWSKNKDDIIRPSVSINKSDRRNDCDVFEVSMSSVNVTDGCPVVNDEGHVIGILVDKYEGHVLYSDEIMKVLDEENLKYSTAGLGMIVYIIIGAAVLLVIIILVVVLVVTKGKKNTAAEVSAPQGGMTQALSEPPVINNVPVQNAPVGPSMRVISLGGALNGKKYSVNGSVKIGRDASRCEIAYPVNTQGVSGCHCELTFDGTVCYLKDMKSSFGTFLSDGTKLTPYAPQMLRSGDSFYLAGPENTFEVRF